MQNLVRNTIIVAVAVLLAVWAITPPDKKLRKGRDIAGGVSLVYAVNTEGLGDKGQVIQDVISVLKQRLDPKGILEINIHAVGNDRVEISMPLPSEETQAFKRAYEETLQTLVDQALTRDDFEALMRLDGASRDAEFESMAGGNTDRLADFRDAADYFDAKESLATTVRSTQAEIATIKSQIETAMAGVPDGEEPPELVVLQEAQAALEAQLDSSVSEVVDARILYEETRAGLLESSVTAEEIRAVVRQSKTPIRIKSGAEYIDLDSPRDRAIGQLRAKYPELETGIDGVLGSFDTYEKNRTGLDDADDLKRMLRNAGVLNFRISIDPGEYEREAELRAELRERGPSNAGSDRARWFAVNKIDSWLDSVEQMDVLTNNAAGFFASQGFVGEEFGGEYYILLWDERGMRLTETEGAWKLASSAPTMDDLGLPAVRFNMDPRGADRLGKLTDPNVGKKMAILLDDQVYSRPPTLNSRISSSGRITGRFSDEEVSYLVRVLNAGSLQAKLSKEPISANELAPTLGADYLKQGRMAGIIALVAVSSFMLLYYFFGGGVAVISLVLNALFLLGAMALQRAAFTLPGIAGVILTFGMAVDANVLIYERIREELKAGSDLRTAVRLGYQRALSSIVDGNVTNLIVCVVLGSFGTPEIKGFAITLGIGVVSTLFTALFVSRLIFSWTVDEFGARKLPGQMLPLAIPVIDRVLSPKIDWMGLRNPLRAISLSLLVAGVVVIGVQANRGQLLGTEFTGGASVTLKFGSNEAPVTLTRAQVEERVHAIPDSESVQQVSANLDQLKKADVIAVDPQADGVTSNTFRIRSTMTDASALLGVLTAAFEQELDAQPPLAFRGAESGADQIALPLTERRLGDNIGRPSIRDDVSNYVGGVAIVLQDLRPRGGGADARRPSLAAIQERLDLVRSQDDFSDTLSRERRLFVIDGTRDAVETAVYVVADERVGYFDDVEHARWRKELQAKEWTIVNEALSRTTTLANVQTFSPTIARTFVAQAIWVITLSVAMIIIYVWWRFGSIRYSLAAIATTVHDVLIVLGLVAVAELVYEHLPFIAGPLMIQPFKLDLALIAALLTVLGYSLNDTIIIMDRIRENRGKLGYASREVVNTSINQTISRTVVTSGTTLIAALILYVWGGEGIRQFAYALTAGVAVGTYSSIAIASPLVWSEKADRSLARARAAADDEDGSPTTA